MKLKSCSSNYLKESALSETQKVKNVEDEQNKRLSILTCWYVNI